MFFISDKIVLSSTFTWITLPWEGEGVGVAFGSDCFGCCLASSCSIFSLFSLALISCSSVAIADLSAACFASTACSFCCSTCVSSCVTCLRSCWSFLMFSSLVWKLAKNVSCWFLHTPPITAPRIIFSASMVEVLKILAICSSSCLRCESENWNWPPMPSTPIFLDSLMISSWSVRISWNSFLVLDMSIKEPCFSLRETMRSNSSLCLASWSVASFLKRAMSCSSCFSFSRAAVTSVDIGEPPCEIRDFCFSNSAVSAFNSARRFSPPAWSNACCACCVTVFPCSNCLFSCFSASSFLRISTSCLRNSSVSSRREARRASPLSLPILSEKSSLSSCAPRSLLFASANASSFCFNTSSAADSFSRSSILLRSAISSSLCFVPEEANSFALDAFCSAVSNASYSWISLFRTASFAFRRDKSTSLFRKKELSP